MLMTTRKNNLLKCNLRNRMILEKILLRISQKMSGIVVLLSNLAKQTSLAVPLISPSHHRELVR